MSKRDPVTGLTDAELQKLAEDAFDQRDDPDAWEDVKAPEVASDVRSVVSVRFNRGELGPIEAAAAAAGVPVSTYIRNAALTAASSVDLTEVLRHVEALREELDQLVRALGSPPSQARRSGAAQRRRVVA